MKKVVIIGSGPAGISAALYLQRSGKVEVTVISSGIGALAKAEKIENYYGFAEPISGTELHRRGVEGARRLGVTFREEEVVALSYDMDFHPVVSTAQHEYPADAVLLATGASRKSAAITGLTEHEGKGVSYCAVCDAFFYRGKDVCVLGSGEYALHEARTLSATSGSVTILTNGKDLTVTVPETIQAITKKIAAIEGETVVERIRFEDGETFTAQGLFVALGVAGSSELARKVGAEVVNQKIKVNEKMETSLPGLYAAGDCIGGTLQVYQAVADGAVAARSILLSFA